MIPDGLYKAVKAWDAQIHAEQEGTVTRKRDRGEKTLFRHALFQLAREMVVRGEPSRAAWAIARLLKVDPKDRLNALAMGKELGVFPANETETAMTMRM